MTIENKPRTRIHATFLLAALWIAPAWSQDEAHLCASQGQEDPDICVAQPFNSASSIDNLKRCVKDLADRSDLGELGRIDQIRYLFDPAKGGLGDDTGPDVKVNRFISFSVPDLGADRISRIVQSLNHDTCDEYVSVSNIAISSPDPRRISVSFHVDGQSWECGSFLGIGYKIELGKAWADKNIVVHLNDDLSLSIEKDETSNVGTSRNPLINLVALLLPVSAPIQVLVQLAIQDKIRAATANLQLDASPVVAAQSGFVAFSSSTASVISFTAAIDLMRYPDWKLSTDAVNSGLNYSDPVAPKFTLAQSTTLPSYVGPAAYSVRRSEIMFLKDLGKSSPRMHTVAAGESLWRIAKAIYPDPHAFLWIAAANGMRSRRLMVGQSVLAPLLYEICEDFIADRIVRPGDTIWALEKKFTSFRPVKKSFISGNLSLIYPYEKLDIPDFPH